MSIFTLTPEELEEIENEEELKVFPEDQECTVRIIELLKDKESEALVRENKNGAPFIMPKLKIIGIENAQDFKTFSIYLALPSQDIEDAEERKKVILKFKRFCKAFDVQLTTEFDTESFVGKEADVILGVEEPKDGYDEKNFIKRFV